MEIKCHLCGADMKVKDIKGTYFPWRSIKAVKLLFSFNALACTGCNEIMLEGSKISYLDELLEKSAKQESKR